MQISLLLGSLYLTDLVKKKNLFSLTYKFIARGLYISKSGLVQGLLRM